MALQKSQNLSSSIWFLFMTLSFSFLVKASTGATNVYIVWVEEPKDHDLKDYAIKLLTSVLGSQTAADKALLYVYKTLGSGFSVVLTPEQASQLKSQPGVISVQKDRRISIETPI